MALVTGSSSKPNLNFLASRTRRLVPALALAAILTGSVFAQTVTPAAPQTVPPATPQAASQATPTIPAPAQNTPATTPQSPATPPAQAPGTPQNPALQPRPDPNAPPSDSVQTIRAFAREVNLLFTVTDSKNHFVTGLKQENFSLLDDRKPPERVIRFSQQTNLPLRVGVLLDTSNSIRQRFQFEQDSAVEFFLQVLHRSDAAFVTGFDVRTDLAQDYTNNIDLLSTAIHKLRPGGGTAFYDAVYKTCNEQMLTLKSDGPIRKAIIVVSDGDDNYSRVEEADAIKMCQRAETIIYTISTNVSPSKDKGDDVLKRLSEATGGRAFYPTRIEDVAIGFRSIEEELRSQYSLQYTPAEFKQDGAFRTIYLFSNDRRFKVRTRQGYFAPRPPR